MGKKGRTEKFIRWKLDSCKFWQGIIDRLDAGDVEYVKNLASAEIDRNVKMIQKANDAKGTKIDS